MINFLSFFEMGKNINWKDFDPVILPPVKQHISFSIIGYFEKKNCSIWMYASK